jgi:hypothetical protein
MSDRARASRRHDVAMASMADLDEPDTAHLSMTARLECELCDDDGYRPNGLTCDHRNREHVGQAQRAHIRKMLAKGGKA